MASPCIRKAIFIRGAGFRELCRLTLRKIKITISSDSHLPSSLHSANRWNEAKKRFKLSKTGDRNLVIWRKSVAHFMGFGDWGNGTPGLHPGLYAAAHFMGLNLLIVRTLFKSVN